GVHLELGYASAMLFALNRLDMNERRAQELLAAGRRLGCLPEIDRAFADGELSWSKVRCLARVATRETEAAWLERCSGLGHREVEALVAGRKRGAMPPGKGAKSLQKPRFTKRFVLERMQHEMYEIARAKLAAELGRAVTDDDLLREMLELFLRSDADGTVPGRKKIDGSLYRVVVAREERPRGSQQVRESEPLVLMEDDFDAVADDAAVTGKLRRLVLDRDGGSCACCGSRRGLMVHHALWRSRGGPTVAENLLGLCSVCHGLV
ncbi:MAG: HNH endonuclease, partial [bacterium]|nr:HNH endonuclease [bacterium]